MSDPSKTTPSYPLVTPATTDLVYVVDDPAGTPTDAHATVAGLGTALGGTFLKLDASNDPITEDLELSKGLIVDTDVLVVDDTNDRVGIGTASPACKLDIKSDTAAGNVIEVENSADTSLLLRVYDNNGNGLVSVYEADGTESIRLAAGAADSWLLDLVGLGLGTSSPGAQLHTTGGRIQSTTRITSADSPYSVLIGDHNIFCDTDGGAITVNLPAGVDGRYLRIVNTGTSGNAVSVTPDGSENLLGANSAFALNDGEALIVVYETTEGWY